MLAALLVIDFLLLWRFVRARGGVLGFNDLSRRAAFVIAFAIQQVLLVLITQISSAFRAFTPAGVLIGWGLVACALLWLLRSQLQRDRRDARAALTRALGSWRRLGALETAALGLLAAFFCVWIVLAIAYPPNSGDALVYHLAKVAHWVQNHTVTAFATQYTAQIELGPLSEYNAAHLHLLSGTDRLDGFVELYGTLVDVIGVSELARRLGLGRRGQWVAALLCATVPSVVLSASNTLNDNFTAAIGVSAVVVAVSFWDLGTSLGAWARRGVAIGCLAALSELAKGTLAPMVWPTVLVLVVLGLWQLRPSLGTKPLARGAAVGAVAAVLAGVVVAGPFLASNMKLFGGATGPTTATTMSTHLTAPAAVGNVIRSVASEYAMGNGKHDLKTDIARPVLTTLESLYSTLGVNPADQNYALGYDTNAFAVTDYRAWDRSEGFGANPLQVTLLVLTLVALAVWAGRSGRGGGQRDKRLFVALAAAVTLSAGFVLFSALARWNVFSVRYYIPALVLWCPLIAFALRRIPRVLSGAILLLAVITVVPQLLNNQTRSLLHPQFPFSSRLAGYYSGFTPDAGYTQRQVDAFIGSDSGVANTIAHSTCERAGIANWIEFEYPIWAALHNDRWRGRIGDVDVQNQSAKLEDPNFHPCALMRQTPAGYVSADAGMVALKFGSLGLAIDPRDINFATTRSPGFASTAPGLHVLPGKGWILGPKPKLLGGAELLVSARHPATAKILLRSTSSAALSSPDARLTRKPGGILELTAHVPAGPSVLHLQTAANKPIGVAAVKISQR